MLNLKYNIIHSCVEDDFKESFIDALSKIETTRGLLKISVFFETDSDTDYSSKAEWMNNQFLEKFRNIFPSVSYIAQKPLGSIVSIELVYADEDIQLAYKSKRKLSYVCIVQGEYKALFLSGISADLQDGIGKQGNSIFATIGEILKEEGMEIDSIVRQWNYIPQITAVASEFQHYQQFNDSRTIFYKEARWANGYPAATGIGTQCGPLVIDLIALQGHDDEFAIKNPRQTDAHVYSDQVLIGENDLCLIKKSTPKFERAKLIVDQDVSVVFVSGTAAIVGEDSLSVNDVSKQTNLTLENIESLIDKDNMDGYKMFSETQIEAMRVYIKNASDYNIIKNICEDRYPEVSKIYLCSDVCRDELLVEIEAFVRCV